MRFWPSREEAPHNLPAPLTSLVGRQAEVAEVAGRLREDRLVTLVGPPGVGKTRLALDTAAQTLDRYPDGAWFIDLSLVSQPALVVQAVASAVSVGERAGEHLCQSLTAHLSEKHLLLVMDNCEHLLDACAQFVCRLAPACGNVSILATSRHELGIVGEVSYPVSTLALPAGASCEEVPASDAARLFLSRVRGGVDLTEGTAAPISRICRRLDGIPLALELAAGRVGELTLDELDANLNHLFELLSTDREGIADRHRTMHAALQWSHDLLPAPERVLLRRLSVFAGPFTADAAREVASPGPIGGSIGASDPARLSAKSLLIQQPGGVRTRYRQHESIRRFARKKLQAAGEEEMVSAAHAQWCVGLVERADKEPAQSAQAESLATLANSHADLRAALTWTMDHDFDLALSLAGGLTRFWVSHGHLEEARTWFGRVLVGGRGEPAMRARALWGSGLVACLLGDFDAVEVAVKEGLALARQAKDGRMQARLLNLRGVRYIFTDPPRAIEDLSRATGLARQHDQSVTLVSSLAMEGFAQALCGDLDAAARLFEECLEQGASHGEGQPRVMGLVGLGHVRLHQGDPVAAQRFLGAGITMARSVGNPIWVALALAFHAELEASVGNHDRARQLATEAIGAARRAGSSPVIGLCLAVAGNVELTSGQPVTSVTLFAEALTCCATGERGAVRSRALAGLGRAKLLLGEQDDALGLLEDALIVAQKGQDRLATATILYWLGRCAGRRDDHETALGMHREALIAQSKGGDQRAIAASLEAVAAELAHEGEVTKAARLLGAVDSLRENTGLARSSEDQDNYETVHCLADRAIGARQREAAARAGAQLPPDRVIAYACGGTGPRRRPPWGWPSLTPTEISVVELVAQRLTNAEIGKRLLMSPGTAKTHLSHIYRKLNLRSRREVAEEVLQRRRNAG